MRTELLAQDDETGCLMRIEVVPGSRTSEIRSVNRWRKAVRVKVAAPPRNGEANAELVQFLAEMLCVNRTGVELVGGAKERIKVVHVPLSAVEALRRLGV